MGVATTNVLDRVMASLGLFPGGVLVRFEACQDVSRAGVLLALPALLGCGLLPHSVVNDNYSFPPPLTIEMPLQKMRHWPWNEDVGRVRSRIMSEIAAAV
jgi:hypothetical protein